MSGKIKNSHKSGVWKSLESKPAETMEGEERSPVRKDNTPDEGIVIKVSQLLGLRGQQVYINEKTLLFS